MVLHKVFLKLPRPLRLKLRALLKFQVVRSYVIRTLAEMSADNEVLAALRNRTPLDLVVHVGAHLAEECWLYESLGARVVLWIEADPELYGRLRERLSARPSGSTVHLSYQALVSNNNQQEIQLRRYSNDGASNSVYSLSQKFASSLPTLKETGEVVVLTSETLAKVLHSSGIHVPSFERSLLVLDVQGHELAVLAGASRNVVSSFSLICVEVSMQTVYIGGAVGDEVVLWLADCGFVPVTAIPESHGDLLLERG